MTPAEIQSEIERLYCRLAWINRKGKEEEQSRIIERINQLQAVYDAMIEANVYDNDYYFE